MGSNTVCICRFITGALQFRYLIRRRAESFWFTGPLLERILVFLSLAVLSRSKKIIPAVSEKEDIFLANRILWNDKLLLPVFSFDPSFGTHIPSGYQLDSYRNIVLQRESKSDVSCTFADQGDPGHDAQKDDTDFWVVHEQVARHNDRDDAAEDQPT